MSTKKAYAKDLALAGLLFAAVSYNGAMFYDAYQSVAESVRATKNKKKIGSPREKTKGAVKKAKTAVKKRKAA